MCWKAAPIRVGEPLIEGNRDITRPDPLDEIAEKTGKSKHCVGGIAVAIDDVGQYGVIRAVDIHRRVDEKNHSGKPALDSVVQRARAGEMRQQILHLIRKHAPSLEEDVFSVGRRKGHGDQLHLGLLGSP